YCEGRSIWNFRHCDAFPDLGADREFLVIEIGTVGQHPTQRCLHAQRRYGVRETCDLALQMFELNLEELAFGVSLDRSKALACLVQVQAFLTTRPLDHEFFVVHAPNHLLWHGHFAERLVEGCASIRSRQLLIARPLGNRKLELLALSSSLVQGVLILL